MRPNPCLAPPHGLLALLLGLAACDGPPLDLPWSTPTDPTVERPSGDTGGEADADTDSDSDTDDDTGPNEPFDMSEADVALYGEWEYCEAGRDVAIGDVNGDGTNDFVVSIWGNQVAVVNGPVEGTRSLATTDALLVSDWSAPWGFDIESGDIDGDGFADILVGNNYDGSSSEISGAVYLVLGPVAGEISLSEADAVLLGEEYGDWVGLSAHGDADGDGAGDLLVGAEGYGDPSTGAVYLLHGPVSGTRSLSSADLTIVGNNHRDEFGDAVALEDLDGDGLDDVAASATSGGAAFVFHDAGSLSGTSLVSDADAILLEDVAGGQTVIEGTGDVDGDGLTDLLLGTTWAGQYDPLVGHAYVVFSPLAAGETSLADADVAVEAEDWVTFEYLSVGDVDGDGAADLLAAHTAFCQLDLLRGPLAGTLSLSNAEWCFTGDAVSFGRGLGFGTALFGNLSDEARSDVVIGVSSADSFGVNGGGAVYAFDSGTILSR